MISCLEEIAGSALFAQARQNTMGHWTKTENIKPAHYIKIEQPLCLVPSNQCQSAPTFAVSTCVHTVNFLYLYGQN